MFHFECSLQNCTQIKILCTNINTNTNDRCLIPVSLFAIWCTNKIEQGNKTLTVKCAFIVHCMRLIWLTPKLQICNTIMMTVLQKVHKKIKQKNSFVLRLSMSSKNKKQKHPKNWETALWAKRALLKERLF